MTAVNDLSEEINGDVTLSWNLRLESQGSPGAHRALAILSLSPLPTASPVPFAPGAAQSSVHITDHLPRAAALSLGGWRIAEGRRKERQQERRPLFLQPLIPRIGLGARGVGTTGRDLAALLTWSEGFTVVCSLRPMFCCQS